MAQNHTYSQTPAEIELITSFACIEKYPDISCGSRFKLKCCQEC